MAWLYIVANIFNVWLGGSQLDSYELLPSLFAWWCFGWNMRKNQPHPDTCGKEESFVIKLDFEIIVDSHADNGTGSLWAPRARLPTAVASCKCHSPDPPFSASTDIPQSFLHEAWQPLVSSAFLWHITWRPLHATGDSLENRPAVASVSGLLLVKVIPGEWPQLALRNT